MALKGTDQAVTRREHDLTKQAKRVIGTDPFGGLTTEGNFTTKIDAVDSNTTYIGLAQIGTETSEASWQIKKIYTSGTITSVTWAGSTDDFTNIWDNHTSLSYA